MLNDNDQAAIFLADIAGPLEEVLRRQILQLATDLKVVFIPDGIAIGVPNVREVRYPWPFSFVDHAEKWLLLRNNSLSKAVVIGNGPLKEHVAVLAAIAHLEFARVEYAEPDGVRDITPLVHKLRMDFFKEYPTAMKIDSGRSRKSPRGNEFTLSEPGGEQ